LGGRGVTLESVKLFFIAACLLASLTACNRPAGAAHEKHYPFTGKVVAVSASDHTATIDGAAIPNYMDAMTMDYPIKSAEDLKKLKPGDIISATVNVDDSAGYNLSDIKVTGKK
jgi:Cu/Ag efflux protein CusF